MFLTIILFSVICVLVTFFSQGVTSPTDSLFVRYLLLELHFFQQHYLWLGLLFGGLAFFLPHEVRHTQTSGKHLLLRSLAKTFFSVILAVVSSFFFVFIIAVLHMVTISVFMTVSPQSVGVVSDKSTIIRYLQNQASSPFIIPTDGSVKQVVVAVGQGSAGKTSLYGDGFLPSIPAYLFVPVSLSQNSVLLLDNTLIINTIEKKDLEIIGPLVGYTVVQNYFPLRRIKKYPSVTIMSSSEYIEYRKRETLKNVALLEKEIAKIQSIISSDSARITVNKSIIATNVENIRQLEIQNKEIYKKCKSSTTNVVACDHLLSSAQETISEGVKRVQNQQKQVQFEQRQIALYETYIEMYKKQISLLQQQQENTPSERGVFSPTSDIHIALLTQDAHAIPEYLATLTHEYFHYASFVSTEKVLQHAFFEEALTEYFTRKTILQNMDIETNLGYPVHIKIVEQMMKLIPESEFADIYFSKDQEALVAALDRVYGDDFYQNNLLLFEALHNARDPKNIVHIANEIMKRIGGEMLKEQDIYSSESRL